MAEIGRLGGQSRSEAKTKAVRLNGAKGGRPRKEQVLPPPRPLSRLELERQRKAAKAHVRKSRAICRNPSLRFAVDAASGLLPADVVHLIRTAAAKSRNRP